ncbi:beta-ketoacyl-ACP synthase [Bartonella tamiae]|uniref:3-oxoacyl-[acyl-carrier-protein] synthase 1 n=1 Tax=Bartonella tamiae Th239 TaxID=1094558 RepID=J1JV12_9HYPH|nr:beta-ketoacyl-ACP synthase [Bartonella tamiae]EJF88812.1 hypothetical protein ME5_01363 [Bartonella tamiae Th239]EJF94938.1 hypothetical protein MEG_00519 [Bartonella tamiae Th307]
MQNHKVVITGIGLISSLGEGVEEHWERLNSVPLKPRIDENRFSPYTVHPIGEIDWNLQIPKRSDQRQMETWQRLGTYAAGLALEDAGIKGDEALTSTMDMIVAAGGGERDINVDSQILEAARHHQERGVLLNHMLSSELRPTLFLAQLSNLLAGNIAIVHKVTGSSRTFMGEEGSGLSAIEIAYSRIRSGQSTHALVGGSYNAEHYDMLLGQELAGSLSRHGWSSVWDREKSEGGGLISGSGGVFLVLEKAENALKRGAKIYAELEGIITDQINRKKNSTLDALSLMYQKFGTQADFFISAASGLKKITQEEQQFLEQTNLTYRGITSAFGHLREAQFPLALAIAAIAVQKKEAFAALNTIEKQHIQPIQNVFISMVGMNRAEGMAKLKVA